MLETTTGDAGQLEIDYEADHVVDHVVDHDDLEVGTYKPVCNLPLSSPRSVMRYLDTDLNVLEMVIISLFVIFDFLPAITGKVNNLSSSSAVSNETANALYDSTIYKFSLIVSIACSSLLLLTQLDSVENVFFANAKSMYTKATEYYSSRQFGKKNNVNKVTDKAHAAVDSGSSDTMAGIHQSIVIIGLMLLLPDVYILFVGIPLRQILVIRSINVGRDTLYMYYFVKQLRVLDPVVWRYRLQFTVVYSIAIVNTVHSLETFVAPSHDSNIMLYIFGILMLVAMMETLVTSSRYLYKAYTHYHRRRLSGQTSQYFSEKDEKRALCTMYSLVLVVYAYISWSNGFQLIAGGPCYYSCIIGVGYSTIYNYLITAVSVTITLVSSYADRKKQASIMAQEKCAFESLLVQMIPPSKMDVYLRHGKISPEDHHDVAIFFSDIEGFTSIAAKSQPYQVMEMLHKVYRIMDHIAMKSSRLYKLETIGDAYVIAAGLFDAHCPEENAIAIANFALIVREAIKVVVSPVDGTPIRMRIGVHSGDVMSGVIGDLMPRWCLFGDTMNTTARLEASCESGCIHASIKLAKYLKKSSYFAFKSRGLVSLKGRSDIYSYNLVSATPANPHANQLMIDQIVEECRALIL